MEISKLYICLKRNCNMMAIFFQVINKMMLNKRKENTKLYKRRIEDIWLQIHVKKLDFLVIIVNVILNTH
ncbi:hypothetical protein ECANGB1_1638 [Enterospora canceri]|uniref:Uncharacterized protein n=1 Tax=Enterospora canceri TaxID=1081671 RepID=A0A1Y1S9T6_9MICR|nr:hypothetical protein ECANGB1_1638 [Enterospora canceri]